MLVQQSLPAIPTGVTPSSTGDSAPTMTTTSCMTAYFPYPAERYGVEQRVATHRWAWQGWVGQAGCANDGMSLPAGQRGQGSTQGTGDALVRSRTAGPKSARGGGVG